MKDYFRYDSRDKKKPKDLEDLLFEEGIVLLEKSSIKYLMTMTEMLQEDFMPVFRKAAELFPAGNEVTKRIFENIDRTKKLTAVTISLRSDKDGKLDIEQSRQLIAEFTDLSHEVMMIEKESAKSKELRKILQQVERETGMTFKTLSVESKIMGSKMGKMIGDKPESKGKFGFIKDHFASELDKMKDFGSTMSDALLGPFSPLVKGGFGAARSAFRAIRDWRIGKRAKKLGARRSATIRGTSDDDLEGRDPGGTTVGESASQNDLQEGWSLAEQTGPQPRDKRGRFTKKPGKAELEAAALPIWYFFDHLAYKARWTKRVIELLEKNVKSGEKSMPLWAMLMIGKLALIALAIGGGIAAGIAVAKFLERFQPKSVDNKMKEDIDRWEEIKEGKHPLSEEAHRTAEFRRAPTKLEKAWNLATYGTTPLSRLGQGAGQGFTKAVDWIKSGRGTGSVEEQKRLLKSMDQAERGRNQIDTAIPDKGIDPTSERMLNAMEEQNRKLDGIKESIEKSGGGPEKRSTIEQYDTSDPNNRLVAEGSLVVGSD
jgi:hypothetical protein